MPLFGSKATSRSNGTAVSASPKPALRVPSPTTLTASRRSLSKALADVVGSRKNDSTPPQRPKIPTAIRPVPTRTDSDTHDDSSTAVESSSSGPKLRAAGHARTTTATTIQTSPLKKSIQNPLPSPTSSSSPTALRTRSSKPGNSSPSSRPQSVAAKAAFDQSNGKSVASFPPGAGAIPKAASIRSPSPGRSTSESPSTHSPSPTVGRRVKAAAPTSFRPLKASSPPRDAPPPTKLQPKTKQSGLRPPKPRPQSAVFLHPASVLPPTRPPLTEQNVKANAQGVGSGLEVPKTSATGLKAPSGRTRARGVSDSDDDESVVFVQKRPMPERAVSPLPRRSLRNMPSLASSMNSFRSSNIPPSKAPTESSNTKENENGKERDSSASFSSRPSFGRLSTLPRASGSGASQPRQSIVPPNEQKAAPPVRTVATTSLRTPSESTDRRVGAKRRRSELPAPSSSTASSQSLLRPPRQPTNRQKTSTPTLSRTATPSTPTSRSPNKAKSAQHTFSVPRPKRVVATPLADMTFSEIPEDEDDDDADVVANDSFRFHVPTSLAPNSVSQHANEDADDGDDADDDDNESSSANKLVFPTPSLFLTASTSNPSSSSLSLPRPTRQRTNTLRTPARGGPASERKRRPTLRPRAVAGLLSPGGPRDSLMPLETSFERSREYSSRKSDVSDILGDIPAPFDTPSVFRGSASASIISEGSLILNENELGLGLITSPSQGTQMSSPVPPGRFLGGEGSHSIARLMFAHPPSHSRSEATSPGGDYLSLSPSGGPSTSPSVISTNAADAALLQMQLQLAKAEAELSELRTHLTERESITVSQQARIASLESELGTVYSVTRARDASNASTRKGLEVKVARLKVSGAMREWNLVSDMVQDERKALRAERELLERAFAGLEILSAM